MLHNFGGTVPMYGAIESINKVQRVVSNNALTRYQKY